MRELLTPSEQRDALNLLAWFNRTLSAAPQGSFDFENSRYSVQSNYSTWRRALAPLPPDGTT
jgi:hypothetical protein